MPSKAHSGTALFIRQRLDGARPSGPACFNTKLAHPINQRGTRQAKPRGCARPPSDLPGGLFQYPENVLPLRVRQSA
jgi:hypothetical protein